ncbi:TolC family protein [Desulfobacula sp.]|uniref:TolC family protein n=1 Tax=Desulfobacula sp. TaxID=2593537 RepID=UPI00262FAC40|nr:TolC family protein [Desulfobacula sp.]
MHKVILKCFVIFLFIALVSLNGYASDGLQKTKNLASELNLHHLLMQLQENHEEIKNFQSQVEQAQAQYLQSKGLYYPTLDLMADGGRQDIDQEFSNDTNENRYNVTLRARQLITDFGKTKGIVDRSAVLLEQAKARLESSRQQLMLEGIHAYINVIRARERLKSAQQSEARIKELTGIEKTLVEKGAGLSSDVLQAKSQLAGAMALRVEAQGELNFAINRFQAIFFRSPSTREIEFLEDIEFPDNQLPAMLEDAVTTARQQNPELLITRYTTQMAQKDIDIAKTAFYPKVNLFAEAVAKDNEDGIIGYRNEASAGMELSYNFFNGGGDKAALKSALANRKATSYHTEYVQRIIQEQVSNSWDQLSILKQKSELLDQQAEIVKNFLLLAKKERKMGTRSLLDVLNGEINYINATATAIAARQDTKMAAYNLLFSMGSIHLQLFE